jgi:secreted trypsin-like serine protease
MKLRLGVLTAILTIAVAGTAASALALIGGSPDGNRHPYVGMAVFFPDGNPAHGFELCSGSLVSPTVFVTAAHCFPDGAVALVDVDANALADLHQPGFGSAVPGVVHVHPGYRVGGNGLARSDLNDVAVITLFAPVAVSRYAQLPAVGYDDRLPNNQPVDTLGYGVQDAKAAAGFGSRLVARQKIVPGGGVGKADFLKLSGGTICNGDSGGPNLQAGTDVVLAINSYGASATCNAVEYSQRLDTPAVAGFLGAFLR